MRAVDRPGFKAMMECVREGDTLLVPSTACLGRDITDLQQTWRLLLAGRVTLNIRSLGIIPPPVGELILATLDEIAQMKR